MKKYLALHGHTSPTDTLIPGTPVVLTGGQTAFGTGVNNTQTDFFIVSGAANTIIEGGGNLVVDGSDPPSLPWDTNTTIKLGTAYHTTDTIYLNGNQNVIDGTGVLTGSNVQITVTGGGVSNPGSNSITLDNYQGTTGINLTGGSDTIALTGDSSTTIGISGGANNISLNAYLGTAKFTIAGGGNTIAVSGDVATTISISGGANQVTLNGDATNTVKIAAGGGDTITVGSTDDGFFGYSTTLALHGAHDTITGGDENFTITGMNAHNTVTLGDGNDTIVGGAANNITVWGGVDTITTGASSTINILGIDGENATSFVPNAGDPGVTLPTDTLIISGLKDTVNATYENVVVNGGTAGEAKINLGNGNNQVTLGGNSNIVNVGNGTNNIFLAGNGSTVTVADPGGIGLDNVSLGNGSGDNIQFSYAGGTVFGTGTGTTTVGQNTGSHRVVNVNLGFGTGLITLGQGSDAIIANGAGSVISAGSGNDTVTANGGGSKITLGNGNDSVTAMGNNAIVNVGYGTNTIVLGGNNSTLNVADAFGYGTDTVTLGNGSGDVLTFNYAGGSVYGTGLGTTTVTQNTNSANVLNVNLNSGTGLITLGQGSDTVTANGGGTTVTAGNGNDNVTANGAGAIVSLGTGNDHVSAIGGGSSVTLVGGAGTYSTVAVGDNSTVYSQLGGNDQISGGAGDSVYLNGLVSGSDVALSGNSNMLFLGSDATTEVDLNHASIGDVVLVQGDAGNTYGGYVDITNFTPDDMMSLQGLVGGTDGNALTNFSEVLANMTGGAFGSTLHLAGGGSIFFDAVTSFTSGQFSYGSSTGPVHP